MLLNSSSEPSDGGLNILRSFFFQGAVRLLQKVGMRFLFASHDDAARPKHPFIQTEISRILVFNDTRNLEGAAFGACLYGLVQNMPQLQRLDCHNNHLCDFRSPCISTSAAGESKR